jgi:regulator of replication initiation timing|tara:strand:+ start:466 stop:702 length:237 start_codon:yes stop_codon:yes gene_type:complete
MSKKISIELQLVDIEEQLETLTERIDKLGSCYDNYMENQTELNVNIYMLLEKLTERIGSDVRVDEDDNPWAFKLMEEV